MARQMTGYAPEELYALEHFPLPLIHPEDRENAAGHFAASVAGQPREPLECRILRKDGSYFYASVTTQPIHATDGRFLGHLGSVHDITMQKVLQQELHGALRQLQAILDTAQVGIAYLKERRVNWFSRCMEEMFGYTLDEVREQTTEVIYQSHEEYEQIGRESYPLFAQGQSYETERLMKRRNGQNFWAHLRGMAVDPQDMAQGSIWILLDIDRLKLAERELLALSCQ